ncbi:MAG: ATP synthase F1 subunit delta [Pirellulaceae bacterium]|nr:ATP synthase F1 subunit delta [Pirellulaceae bacterium]
MADLTQTEQNESYDTDQQYIAGVYAKSLLEAVAANENSGDVLEQLDSFVGDVLNSVSGLAEFLVSPRIPSADKSKLIETALREKADPILINFLKVLNNHGRLDCLRAINNKAKELFNEQQGRIEAFVTVADQLPAELESTVGEKLKKMLGKEVILSITTDPEIIGGMIVKVGDTVYDSSVANRLRQLRETVVDGAMLKVRQSINKFATE